MGLDISCKHSDKHITWSYSTLHHIRDLALQTCGVDLELARVIRCSWNDDIDLIKYFLNKPEIQIKIKDLYGFQLAGFYYPNLLFHSDCEGKYTANGKPLNGNWETGNIKDLHKELIMLKEESRRVNNEYGKELLEQLLDLVSDELKHKAPTIYFG